MADLVLLDGKEITFDLSKVTHKEFVQFWGGRPQNMTTKQEKDRDAFENDFIFKICGLTAEQLDELPQPDWRRFFDKFRRVSFAPVEEQEKNSPSASTSQE